MKVCMEFCASISVASVNQAFATVKQINKGQKTLLELAGSIDQSQAVLLFHPTTNQNGSSSQAFPELFDQEARHVQKRRALGSRMVTQETRRTEPKPKLGAFGPSNKKTGVESSIRPPSGPSN